MMTSLWFNWVASNWQLKFVMSFLLHPYLETEKMLKLVENPRV